MSRRLTRYGFWLVLVTGVQPVVACEYQAQSVTVQTDGSILLPASADAGRAAFLIERDFNLKVQIGDALTDSWPAPSANEPVWLPPQSEPSARIQLKGVKPGQRIEAQIGCDRSPDHPEYAAGEALQAVALLSGRYRQANSTELARALSLKLWQLRLSTDDTRIQEWIDLQLIYVIRNSGFMDVAERIIQRFLDNPHYQSDNKSIVLYSKAQNKLDQGDASALELMKQAAAQLQEAGYYSTARFAFQDVCVLMRLNSDSAATECLAEAAERFAKAGMPLEQSGALLNLFTAMSFFGRYHEAREVLQRASDLIEANGDRERRARLALSRSAAANWRGDSEAALRELSKAENLYQSLEAQAEVGRVQSLIGNSYSLAGDDARALSWYQRAERSLELSAATSRRRENLLSQARALHRLERDDEALQVLNRLSDQSQVSADAFSGSWALDRAEVLLALGKTVEAREQLDAVPKHQLTLPQQRRQLRIDVRLGAAQSTSERLQAALAEDVQLGRWVAALDDAEALLCCGELGEADARSQLDNLIGELLRQVETRIGQLRGPGMRHALLRSAQEIALARHRRQKQWGVPEAQRLTQLTQQLDRLRQLALTTPTEQQGDQLDALEEAVADAWLGGATSVSDDRHLRWVARMPASGAQQTRSASSKPVTLRAGDVLVYPVLGRRSGLMLWSTAGDGGAWQTHSLDDPAELRKLSRTLLQLLSEGHASIDEIERIASELSASLGWRSITQSAARIVLLVDAQTAAIPFNLFDPPEAQRPVVLLQSMRPVAPLEVEQLILAAAAQASDQQAVLAQSSQELDEVALAWKALPKRRKDRIDLIDIQQALATPNSLLHIAAHGSGARRVEEDSGLWLTASNASGVSFLSSVRVQRLPLASEAVVLSACESGYSQASGSLGMGGLAGALVDAGAKVVVGSRWAVSDRAARVFSVALHRAWSEHPDQLELALLKAQAAVRAQRAFRHPTHWAGWFWLQRGPIVTR